MRWTMLLLLVVVVGCGSAEKYVAPLPQPQIVSEEEFTVLFSEIVSEHYGEPPGVVLVEFADYQCPFCQQVAGPISSMKKQFGAELAVIHEHFPLDRSCNAYIGRQVHPFACEAAVAAECARNQGKFEEYNDVLYKEKKFSDGNLRRYAKDLGIDTAVFNDCFEEKKTKPLIMKQIERGVKMGVKGTPTLFLNGRQIQVRTSSELAALIELELKNR